MGKLREYVSLRVLLKVSLGDGDVTYFEASWSLHWRDMVSYPHRRFISMGKLRVYVSLRVLLDVSLGDRDGAHPRRRSFNP